MDKTMDPAPKQVSPRPPPGRFRNPKYLCDMCYLTNCGIAGGIAGGTNVMIRRVWSKMGVTMDLSSSSSPASTRQLLNKLPSAISYSTPFLTQWAFQQSIVFGLYEYLKRRHAHAPATQVQPVSRVLLSSALHMGAAETLGRIAAYPLYLNNKYGRIRMAANPLYWAQIPMGAIRMAVYGVLMYKQAEGYAMQSKQKIWRNNRDLTTTHQATILVRAFSSGVVAQFVAYATCYPILSLAMAIGLKSPRVSLLQVLKSSRPRAVSLVSLPVTVAWGVTFTIYEGFKMFSGLPTSGESTGYWGLTDYT